MDFVIDPSGDPATDAQYAINKMRQKNERFYAEHPDYSGSRVTEAEYAAAEIELRVKLSRLKARIGRHADAPEAGIQGL